MQGLPGEYLAKGLSKAAPAPAESGILYAVPSLNFIKKELIYIKYKIRKIKNKPLISK